MKKLLIILLASSLSVGNTTEKSLSREATLKNLKSITLELFSLKEKKPKIFPIANIYLSDCLKDNNLKMDKAPPQMSDKNLNIFYSCAKKSLEKSKKDLGI